MKKEIDIAYMMNELKKPNLTYDQINDILKKNNITDGRQRRYWLNTAKKIKEIYGWK